MCKPEKRRYLTAADAEAELARTRAKLAAGITRRQECRYYRCPDCLCYHLTSIPLHQLRRTPS